MYYFRAIGWFLLSLFGLCSVAFVFALTFPGMFKVIDSLLDFEASTLD